MALKVLTQRSWVTPQGSVPFWGPLSGTVPHTGSPKRVKHTPTSQNESPFAPSCHLLYKVLTTCFIQ